MINTQYNNQGLKSTTRGLFSVIHWRSEARDQLARLRTGSIDAQQLDQTTGWLINGLDPTVLGRWMRHHRRAQS